MIYNHIIMKNSLHLSKFNKFLFIILKLLESKLFFEDKLHSGRTKRLQRLFGNTIFKNKHNNDINCWYN